MTQSTGKHQALLIVLLVALSVLNGCGGDVSNTGGGGVQPPGTPTGLRVTVSSETANLSWNAAANAWRYNIYYSNTPGVTSLNGAKLSTAATSFTHQGLTNGLTYYYVVTAQNSIGQESANSAAVSAKLAAPNPPTTFIAVASSGTSTPQISLSWSAVNEATSFNIYRDTTPSVTTLIAAGINGTAYTDTNGLANGTPYYYVVKGVSSFGTGPASLVSSATPTSGLTGNITISGTVTYEDIEYDQTVGYTGVTMFKAVRFADVELVNATTSSPLASTTTGTDGSYSFSRTSTDLEKSVYVRVLSSATPTVTASQAIDVKTSGGSLYSVKTGNFTFTGNATVNLSIPVTNTAGGAFNILDVMTSGFQFIDYYAGSAQSLSLNVFWEYGVSDGTYFCNDATYCPLGIGIYVFSDPFGSGDTDEFDDDVLFHEFGHFTAANFSKDDSMGGPHYLNKNDYDMRLTWSEGWGNFFQGAVKFWLNSTNPSLLSSKPGVPLSQYVDTVSGQAYLIVDVNDPDNSSKTPTWGGNSPYCYGTCYFSTNEISVANVLWNHLTGTGNYGMQPVWDVIAGFKSSAPSVVNLETFWDRWLLAANPNPIAVYQNRLIDYSNDGNEVDDTSAAASPVTVNAVAVNHRLYSAVLWPNVDVDYVKFDVPVAGVQYTITTSNLRNGADTYLTLYDSDGITPISATPTTRDNASGITWIQFTNYDLYIGYVWQEAPLNNTTNLASRIITFPAHTGTFYVGVTPSLNRPQSAGKYGSYDIRITSP